MTSLHKLNGIFAVIKKKGVTSTAVTEGIRIKLLEELDVPFSGAGCDWLKVGHGGTLDLEASGVLAVGLGSGCKLLKHFLHGDKKYRCTAKLGTETDTYNDSDHVTRESFDVALQSFVGSHLQTPPRYSALKHQGFRLSDLARGGIPAPAPKPRPVVLHQARCLDFTPPDFTIDIHCGGGFYVRSLVHDLGKALGTCCHLVDLTRTQHAGFTEDMAVAVDTVTVDTVLDAIRFSRHLVERRPHKDTRRRKQFNVKAGT